MPVIETSDSFLFLQVAEHDRVILKYHTDDCGSACKDFIPVFENLSNDPTYKEIIFLVIDADDNPMAKRRILDKHQPVITIYYKGKLLDSRHASSKEGVQELLEELLKTS
ncbi:MAG: thioredoxin family protein [Burkholderiales bacterium]|nr:thioredoxin family protein [Bacteroidia bacterium]